MGWWCGGPGGVWQRRSGAFWWRRHRLEASAGSHGRCVGSAKTESCEQRVVGHLCVAWRAAVLSWRCWPGLFPWRGRFDCRKAVPWSGRRPSRAVLDLAGDAGWLQFLVQAGSGVWSWFPCQAFGPWCSALQLHRQVLWWRRCEASWRVLSIP
ncbi:hypothetical protein VPH35_008561 [Triticum aestivum]